MKDFAVLIGRFQPVHKGHGYLIKQALNAAQNLIIIIGSSFGSRTLRNSFTCNERKEMILDILNDQDFSDYPDILNKVNFVFVKDYIYDKGDKLWIEDVTNGVNNIIKDNKSSIVLIGHKKDNTSYYLKNFPKWNYIECDNYKNINSTDIRLNFFEKNKSDILNNCYQSTIDWLKDFRKGKLFKQLHEEYLSMIEYKKLWKGAPFAPIFVTCDSLVICDGSILLIKENTHRKGLNCNARWFY